MSPCPRPAAADRQRPSAVVLACWRAAMLALMSSGPLAAAVGAAENCRTPSGQEQPPVAQLVSVVGEVTVRGVVQPGAQGTLPFVPICAGDLIAVGSASRAAVYVLEADTPLRLDEDTVGQIAAPPGPGSGIVELTRGAVYFLSQVRRTLTIRTPYVNAGIEGTEVYLRVREPRAPAVRGAELIVLEGRVALTPGAGSGARFVAETAMTGERVDVTAAGLLRRTVLPSPGGAYGALRQVAVGELSWTLFYPDVLTQPEAAAFPRIAEAARLLAAGQVAETEEALASVPPGGTEAGLRDALQAIIAVGRQDAAAAMRLAEQAVATAPGSAVPQLSLSYARQLATDLDGAFAAAETAVGLAPREPLSRARLAEVHLMRGEIRQARRAAEEAVALGGGPLAQMVLGYAELAALRGARGEAAFRRALRDENWNPLALLGLGLAQIKQGGLDAGTVQIENAVAHDPSSSLLRSYLGRAQFEERRNASADTQLAIAKQLDPSDPTPWFYAAMLDYRRNRPLPALRNMEKSIELNDERAPFRSSLLLDRDLATRTVTLSRIYDTLGFNQLAVQSAARALADDPTNPNAHRYVADAASVIPGQEIIRISETFKAQLLEQPNREPVSPTVAYRDLSLAVGQAFIGGFNEFTSAFDSDGASISALAGVGSYSTLVGETVASALAGPVSISAGLFHSTSDGFRRNADLENTLHNLFIKGAFGANTIVQAEYRHRETDRGDITLNGDPNSYNPGLSSTVNKSALALGARTELSPGSTILAAITYGENKFKTIDEGGCTFPGCLTDDLFSRTRNDGTQLEAQHILDYKTFNVIYGTNISKTKYNDNIKPFNFEDNASANSKSAYGSIGADLGRMGHATAGLSVVHFDRFARDDTILGPLVGARIDLTDAITVRGFAARTARTALVTQQTLQPVELEGFSIARDDLEGTSIDAAGLGFDVRPTRDVSFGLTATQRQLHVPIGDSSQNWDDSQLAGYGYWIVNENTTTSVEPTYSVFTDNSANHPRDGSDDLYSLRTIAVPFAFNVFLSNGLFGRAVVGFLDQRVRLNDGTVEQQYAYPVDMRIGYRLQSGRGILALDVNNIFNDEVWFYDDNFRTNEARAARVSPERSVFARAVFRF